MRTVLIASLLIGSIAGLEATAGAGPTVPGVPRVVTAVPFKNGTVTVSWQAPTTSGGSAIMGYNVTPYLGSSVAPTQQFDGSATKLQLAGLQVGMVYQFAVAARNAMGTGVPSAKSATVTVGAPRKPLAPITTWSKSPGHLTVTFYTPYNGGAPITSFTTTCASANGGVTRSQTGPPTVSGSGDVLVVGGLTFDKRYNCRVRATNSRGTGPFSGGGPYRRVAAQ